MAGVTSSQSPFEQYHLMSKPEKRDTSMREYDLYINPKKLSIGTHAIR